MRYKDPHRRLQIVPLSFSTRLFRELMVFAGLLILGLGLTGYGQSGRRLPKVTAPEAKPEVSPEEKPSEKRKPDEKARVEIVLGIDESQFYQNIPTYFYDSVLQSCADKLLDAPSVKLTVTGRDMNRSDAVKLAKSQKEAFVALLGLRSERSGLGTASQNTYGDMSVEYVVFAPDTAKVVTSGKTYPRTFGKGGVVVGPGTQGRNSAAYVEQMLRQAGRDAGERILSALHLVLPERTIPQVSKR
jgi:hypothetical protein